jgi:hypothetical protein
MRLTGTEALVALLGKASNRRLVVGLTSAGVEFVVIGGVALAYHGIRDPFEVDDLDLLLEPNKKTAETVTSALSAVLPNHGVVKEAIKPGSKIVFRVPNSFYADLIFGEEIEKAPEIIDGSILVMVGSTALRVASIGHLRTMKERVVENLRQELKTLERNLNEFKEKLKRHERDLDALKAA